MSLSKLGVLALTTVLASSVWALNPIHEATYTAYPAGLSHGQPSLHMAAIVPKGGDVVSIPAGLSFGIGRTMEIGAGLKTVWGNEGEHFNHAALGFQVEATSRAAFGAHLLIDLQDGSNHGLTLTGHKKLGLGKRLSSEWDIRLGFMDALVEHDALMAMEGGIGLTLRALPSLALQAGLVASSQTKHFDEHFALDFQPGVFVPLSREGGVQMQFTFGLSGDRQEQFVSKIGVIHAF